MSSNPTSDPNFLPHPASQSISPSPEAESGGIPAPAGGLAAIVRKTLGEPEGAKPQSTAPVGDVPTANAPATNPPRGKKPDKPARGPRRPKPAGGDAPGDDGEGNREEHGGRESFSRSHVPVPSKRGPLSADLEAEMAAALGELSLDAVLQEGGVAKSAEKLEPDSRHRSPVMKIFNDNVFFSLGGRNEGVASLRSFPTPPAEGDMFDVFVSGRSREDGLYDLSVAGGAIVTGDWSDIREGSVVEARISAANTGGLEAQVNNIRAFIPAGQVSIFRAENLGDFVGQKLVCVVIEANERRGNVFEIFFGQSARRKFGNFAGRFVGRMTRVVRRVNGGSRGHRIGAYSGF